MNDKILRTMLFGGAGIGLFGLGLWATFAQVPEPFLKITQTGSNTFQIQITNGVPAANYELYSTPILEDVGYPWTLYSVGAVAQTNFSINSGTDLTRYFIAAVGSDWDSDGIPNGEDGNPSDANVGRLTIYIDNPANGVTFD